MNSDSAVKIAKGMFWLAIGLIALLIIAIVKIVRYSKRKNAEHLITDNINQDQANNQMVEEFDQMINESELK